MRIFTAHTSRNKSTSAGCVQRWNYFSSEHWLVAASYHLDDSPCFSGLLSQDLDGQCASSEFGKTLPLSSDHESLAASELKIEDSSNFPIELSGGLQTGPVVSMDIGVDFRETRIAQVAIRVIPHETVDAATPEFWQSDEIVCVDRGWLQNQVSAEFGNVCR